MDHRALRREFEHDLRLIGGIDGEALRRGKAAIRRKVEEKVPPLLEFTRRWVCQVGHNKDNLTGIGQMS